MRGRFARGEMVCCDRFMTARDRLQMIKGDRGRVGTSYIDFIENSLSNGAGKKVLTIVSTILLTLA